MSYSEKWQAAKDARRGRRANDPAVQKRRQERERRAARENAKRAGQDEAVEALRARQLDAVGAS